MRKLILWLLLLVIIGGPIALAFAAVEPEPSLPESAVLTPKQAARSKALIKRVRAVAKGEASGDIEATRSEVEGLIATAQRVSKDLRGRSDIDAFGMSVALSARVPGLPQAGWINFRGEIAPSEEGLDVQVIRLGRLRLPPELTVSVMRGLLDLVSDDDIGTALLASVRRVQTSDGRVQVTLDAGGTGDASIFDRVVSGVRGAAGMTETAAVKAHYDAIQAAAERGDLPAKGSLAPWLAFAVARVDAAGHADADAVQEDMRAAILALAAHCGDRSVIETAVGRVEGPRERSACGGLRLAGRDDTRKHFILSAGLQATSGAAVSFGMGEVKELVDAGTAKGSGFSFDDIAADRAGLRWAERLGGAAPEELARLAGLSSREAGFMPSIDGLPSFMSEAEFKARFGEVDSDRYKAQLAEIDARIDALPIHSR